MKTLGTLWSEIIQKDSSFYIEQIAFSDEVVICSRFNTIRIEGKSLSAAILLLWELLYESEVEYDRV